MPKFQRKPAIVEAIQFNGQNQDEIVGFAGCLLCVPVGYWVVKGVVGDIYPCSPEVFESIYQPAVNSLEVAQSDEAGKPISLGCDLATPIAPDGPDTVPAISTWEAEPTPTEDIKDCGKTPSETPSPEPSEPAPLTDASV